MTFVQPLFLLALLALPIIVLLHLLRQRQRRLVVPSLQLWLNLPLRPGGERVRRLPLTLLLLLHLLVATLLALALGQPQLALPRQGGSLQTALIVDTTTSMAAASGGSTRFEQARRRARRAIEQLAGDERLVLIAAGPQARLVASGGAAERVALISALNQLRPGGSGLDLRAAVTLGESLLDPLKERRVVLISDGAFASLERWPGALPIQWTPLGDQEENRAIVAFAARPWGDHLQVYLRAANYSSALASAAVRLYADDALVQSATLSFQPGGESELAWTLDGRHTSLRAELDGADALPLDDQAFARVPEPRPLNVALVVAPQSPALVSGGQHALSRALESIPGVRLVITELQRYDPGSGAPVDLSIFDGVLPERWPAGALLLINPPPGSALLQVAQGQGQTPRGALLQRGALLEGLSFGGVSFGRVPQLTPPDWAATQLAIGDTPLIMRGAVQGQLATIWAFDLARGNLPTRLAFPLLLARTVRDLTPSSLPPALLAGEQLLLRPDPRADSIKLTAPDGSETLLPATAQMPMAWFDQPGFYRVEERLQGQPRYSALLGVNAGTPLESDLRLRQQPALEPQQDRPAAASEERAFELWPWLLLIALAVMLLEWGYSHL